MTGFPWVYLIDTSPRTDFILSLGMTSVVGGVTIWEAVALGLGLATVALALLTCILVGVAWYAWLLWRRDEDEPRRPQGKAVKVRAPR